MNKGSQFVNLVSQAMNQSSQVVNHVSQGMNQCSQIMNHDSNILFLDLQGISPHL